MNARDDSIYECDETTTPKEDCKKPANQCWLSSAGLYVVESGGASIMGYSVVGSVVSIRTNRTHIDTHIAVGDNCNPSITSSPHNKLGTYL